MHTLVKQLRQLRSPAARTRTGTFYIEGLRMVQQALRSGVTIELLVAAPALFATPTSVEVVTAACQAGIRVVELSAADFSTISFKQLRHGIGAVVRSHVERLDSVRLAADDVWIALDRVGNPGNVGAIMRTCDAVQCPGILLLGDTADPYHPDAIQASMGAVFAVRLVRTTFAEFAAWADSYTYPVVGTSPFAMHAYREVVYPSPVIVLMGSERTGLSVAQQAACTLLTRIPMAGTSNSLNVAVATSVVLYEVYHQHRRHTATPRLPEMPSAQSEHTPGIS